MKRMKNESSETVTVQLTYVLDFIYRKFKLTQNYSVFIKFGRLLIEVAVKYILNPVDIHEISSY